MESHKPKLYYWGIKARAQLPSLFFEYGGVSYEWVSTFEWPGTLKDQTPFGQLPFLEDGSVRMGQSMAIARYAARKAGLQGDNDADVAMSEQLIEEQNDVYNLLAKAQYSAGDKEHKDAAFKNVIENDVPKHLASLEKLLHGHNHHFGSKVLAGDLAIFAILDILHDLDAAVLDKTPKLKAFFEHLAADSKVAAWKGKSHGPYFRNPSFYH